MQVCHTPLLLQVCIPAFRRALDGYRIRRKNLHPPRSAKQLYYMRTGKEPDLKTFNAEEYKAKERVRDHLIPLPPPSYITTQTADKVLVAICNHQADSPLFG